MFFVDKASIGKRVTDQNGFVSAPAVITRVGIQKYHVDELRRDKRLTASLQGASGLVSVFRPKDTVFNPLTIDSFRNLPVTVGHPQGGVSPRTARFVQTGHVGEDVKAIDEKNLGCTIHLTDKDAIDISKGIETSAGYECPIVADEGEFEGEKYKFRFDGPMIGNHLALVEAGRCGSECSVLDNEKENAMEDKEVKVLVKDTVETVVPAIVKTAVKDAITAADLGEMVSSAVKASVEAMEDKRKDEAAKAKAKADAKALADAATQKSISLRAKLIPLMGDSYDASKSDKELMVMALGDAVKDADSKSEEYLVDKLDEISTQRKDTILKSDSASTRTLKLTAL